VTSGGAAAHMIALTPARAEMRRPKDPVCTVAAPTLDHVLTRTQSRLMENGTLTVVAIGSSSNEGAGASSSSASYPSRLEALLKMRFPAVTVRVINRGV